MMTTETNAAVPNACTTRLWNPNAAVNWSLLFSPVFGSYLQYQNWRALGEKDKADTTLIWFIFSWLALTTQVAGLLGLVPTEFSLPAVFIYYVIWFFLDGRKQNAYLKVKYENMYAKKSWKVPLLIAIPIYYVLMTISFHNYRTQNVSADTPEIKLVKTGHVAACQAHTMEKMVNGFMTNPKWESGKAAEDGKTYVNVKGKILYHNKPVEAAMQFLITGDNFTFHAYEINGVPTEQIMALALVAKMCDSVAVEDQPVVKPLTTIPATQATETAPTPVQQPAPR
jgi:hypothetical protein